MLDQRRFALKLHLTLLALACLTLAAVPAMAQGTIYDNGPINGEVDAFTINFGFAVSDTFHLANSATVGDLSFGAWLEPGDTMTSVEVAIGSSYFSNNLFDGIVTLTQSDCFANGFGFSVCQESGNFNGPSLGAGNYFLTLENATTNDGDPTYWDQNSGVGCTSPGCPSQAENDTGSIPSEAFTLSGSSGTTTSTGTTPEPGSILLFASGFLGVAGILRRKLL
jgi:hypothetical protein